MRGMINGKRISHGGTHEKNFGKWEEARRRNAETAATGMLKNIISVTSAPK